MSAHTSQTLWHDDASSSAQQLDLAAHDISNVRGELVQTGDAATAINLAGAFDNRSGQLLVNSRSLSVAAARFDNNAGTLYANGDTALTTGDLDNSGGRISAAVVRLAASELLNRDGQISAGQSLQATTTRGIDNSGGSLIANTALKLASTGLDNRSGTLGSITGSGEIDAGAGTINNQNGTIAVAQDLGITAAALLNTQGEVAAGRALAVSTTATIDNAQGALSAGQQLILNASQIDNAAGAIGSVNAAVDITATNGNFNNTAGRIEALKTVSLSAFGIANTDGTIVGQSVLANSNALAFDNARGKLVATGADLADTLDIESGALNNDGGLIQATAAIAVDTHGQTLTNTNSGAGGIVGQSSVSLSTGDLDNRAGYIGSGEALTIDSAALSNRQGGLLASGGIATLTGSRLDNRGGQVQAVGNVSIALSGGLDNTGSLLRSGQNLSVGASNIVNANTQGADQGLEGDNVALSATNLDNAAGAIRSNDKTILSSSGTIDNNNGLLSAGNRLAVLDPAASKTLAITNSLGTLIAGQQLTLDAARLTGNGELLSQGDLSVKLTQDYENTGQVRADGNTSVETSATLSNRGELSAGNTLALKAATIENDTGATIKGAQVELQATAAHTLTNRGLVDGNEVFFDTITLDNLGTGRIYGDHVAIAATSLNNRAEGASTPVIAARDRLDIGATTIHNRDGALLFSAGDLAIGGALDASHQASGQALALTNTSASIEALGQLTLSIADLTNQRRDFAMARVLSSDLPQGLEMLTYNPSLQFFWGIKETNPVNWRNFLRDRYIGSINGLLGGTLDGGYRAQLEALVNAQPRSVFEDSINIWNLLLAKINADHPEYVTTMAAALSSQRYPLRTYNQLCRDTECDYVTYLVSERTDYNDVVTRSAPAAGILAGGNASIAATRISNAYSLIEAGGDMNLTGSSLTNSGAELFRQSDTITTTHVLHWVNRDHGTSVSSASSSTVIGTVPGLISAGGTLSGSFTDRIDNLTLRQGTAPLATPSGTTIVALDTGHGAPNPTGINAAVAALTAAQNVTRIVEVQSLASNPGGPAIIRTVTPNTTLPSNALYHATANPTANVLIETDPAFAGYRQWLTSEYMLAALGIDIATSQKRLSDGFYEQRLIAEQVSQLTGRRFLEGYSNDEAQYQALMDAGVSVAQAWAIRPGIALSAEQMAQLTSDIVLLVEKDVQLPDGTTQKVLVPQVYARLQDGDLAPSGALLAANTIDLQVGGDLTTSGSIAGRQLVSLTAENISNLRGRIAGQSVGVAARNDLTLDGGTISAQDRLIAAAGNTLTVQSSSADLAVRLSGTPSFVNSRVVDRVAGLYVSGPDALLVASAGNDLKLLGGVIQNSGNTTAAGGGTALVAGNDLSLGTVVEASNSYAQAKNSWRKEQSANEVGSLVQATGDLTLIAGNDLTARAASVASGGALAAQAGNDLNITAGEATYDMESYRKIKKSGFASSTTKINRDAEQSTSALSSLLSGDSVSLIAGRDLQITGSNVVGTGDTTLTAGNNLTIEAARQTHSETHYEKTTQSGLFSSGGVGFTIGSRMLSTDQKSEATSAAASTVGSTDGDVLMRAGNAYRQVGSDVIAVKGDIDIAAKTVDILEARETNRSTTETKSKQSGLTIAITSPVISAIQTVQQMSQAASDTKDSRMQLLAAANIGLSANNAYGAVMAGQGTSINGKANQIATKTDDAGKVIESRDATAADKVGGINLSISIGGSKSSSSSTQTSATAAGSRLSAGNDIRINASGAGQDSDITVQGSNLQASNAISLKADDEIKLLAAQNIADQHSNNKNSSASIGFSIGSNGFMVNVGASAGRGNADGADTWWTNTHLDAGKRISLDSGGDTSLIGAVVNAEQISAKVGGNLVLESLQDLSAYDSKQKSAGFSLSVGVGMISGSLSLANSKINSDYASVTEQSGLKAGDGGFDVSVHGNTDLAGAVITSTQGAIDANQNRFQTGGALTLSDLENKAAYSAKSTSVNLGTSMSFDGKLVPGGTGVGIGSDKGKANSTTLAAISGLAGNTAARTGDAETGIAKIFDAEKVQKEINAQVVITQSFGQQASAAVGSYVQSQKQVLREAYTNATEADRVAIQAQFDDVILQERVINVLIGAVTGLSGSALAKETLSVAAEEMQRIALEDSMRSPGIVDKYGNALTNLRPGEENKPWQDRDLAGTRLDLDGICGADNRRCLVQKNEDGTDALDANGKTVLALTEKGQTQFAAKDESGNFIALPDFLNTAEGRKMEGSTGGIQGGARTFMGYPYPEGGVVDQVFKAFGGAHDNIGGALSGLYDESGNTQRGRTDAEKLIHEAWSGAAIVPSAPFAMARLLPPEVWKAISILLGVSR